MDAAPARQQGGRLRRRIRQAALAIVVVLAGAAFALLATHRVADGPAAAPGVRTTTSAAPGAASSADAPRDGPATPAVAETDEPPSETPQPTRGNVAPAGTASPETVPRLDPTPSLVLPGLKTSAIANTLLPPGLPRPPQRLPLDELSPEAARLAAHAGTAGVAVLVPDDHELYEERGYTPFPLASLVKVPIMLTLLDQAASASRALTEEERDQLEQMIRVSDNEAASALWEELGGGAAVADFLQAAGVEGIGMASNHEWGDSQGTPAGVAGLLAAVADRQLPRPGTAETALELLSGVIEDQRWGVSAGFQPRDGELLLLKNGWFPADDGWWVNSAGMVLRADGSPRYVLVVLTKERASEETGRRLIEAIAAAVHSALRDS